MSNNIKTSTYNILTGEIIKITYGVHTKEFKKICRDIHKGNKHSEETKKKISEGGKEKHKGPRSEETKEKIRKARAKQIITEEHKRKISEGHKGKIKSLEHRKHLSEAGIGHEVSEETKRKMRETMNTEDYKEKSRIRRANQTFPIKDTEPELDIQDTLLKQGIPFETHKVIKGLLSKPFNRHQWDIVLEDKKILIEVQGCYWHGCLKCFPNPNENQKKWIEKDKVIFSEARSKGWKVIEIWEHTIRESEIQFKYNLDGDKSIDKKV